MVSCRLSVCLPSVCRMYIFLSIFSFPEDNLSKYKWKFTKLGVCIDSVEVWFGILLMGKFHPFLTALSAHDTLVFSFTDNNFNKYQWIFTCYVH